MQTSHFLTAYWEVLASSKRHRALGHSLECKQVTFSPHTGRSWQAQQRHRALGHGASGALDKQAGPARMAWEAKFQMHGSAASTWHMHHAMAHASPAWAGHDSVYVRLWLHNGHLGLHKPRLFQDELILGMSAPLVYQIAKEFPVQTDWYTRPTSVINRISKGCLRAHMHNLRACILASEKGRRTHVIWTTRKCC